jgi:predicted DCC family thiol-disulfide oxidoreductase YuxK
VLLYDGHCRFCTAQSKNMLRLAKPGAIEMLSFQDEGVLARFPGLTHEQCMKAMQLIAPDGRVFSGAEAAVRALATRPIGKLAFIYYMPLIRQLVDLVYFIVARNRYRLGGKVECADEACALHLKR